jgi:hypothetical protein
MIGQNRPKSQGVRAFFHKRGNGRGALPPFKRAGITYNRAGRRQKPDIESEKNKEANPSACAKGNGMAGILFKFFGIAIAIVVIIYMAVGAFRRSRRLDARIREFKAEQDALDKEGRAVNPYAALSELYAERKKKGK